MATFTYEYTDTIAGEANYCWVKRGKVHVHDLVDYGYTGSADGSYSKADTTQIREVMKKVKADLGLTGVRGVRESWGGTEVFKPYGMNTILFVEYHEYHAELAYDSTWYAIGENHRSEEPVKFE